MKFHPGKSILRDGQFCGVFLDLCKQGLQPHIFCLKTFENPTTVANLVEESDDDSPKAFYQLDESLPEGVGLRLKKQGEETTNFRYNSAVSNKICTFHINFRLFCCDLCCKPNFQASLTFSAKSTEHIKISLVLKENADVICDLPFRISALPNSCYIR